MVRDKVGDWRADREQKKIDEAVAEKDARIAERDRLLELKTKEAIEWRVKYDLAIRAMDAENNRGVEIDAAITDQIRRMEKDDGIVDAPAVPDDELLERLRAREKRQPRRTQP